MKQVIGFAGRKRSGKTALSMHLAVEKGATIVTVADALKSLCCKLIGVDTIKQLNKAKDDPSIGLNLFQENSLSWNTIIGQALGFLPDMELNYDTLTEAFINMSEDTKKKMDELSSLVYTYLCKEESNVRELIQYIGTDIIRHFDPDWHVKKMIEAINNAPTDLVVVDDVRFPNERKAIEDLNGTVFFIIRPDLRIPVSNHRSETSLTWTNFNDDRILLNMYDLETMFKSFDDYMNTGFVMGTYCPSFKHGSWQFDKYNHYFGYKATCSANDEKIIKEYVLPNLDKTGGFVFHTHNEKLAENIADSLYIQYIRTEGPAHTFMIWDPFIIENLKQWL